MAPSKAAAATAPFSKDERVLCFHHDMLYEAKVLDSRPTEDNTSWQYRIHYHCIASTRSAVRASLSFCPEPETMAPTLQNLENRSNIVIANSWDDWVPQDRVRKFTDENKELAAQLHTQMKILQTKAPKSLSKKGRTNGSDFSSARGSEERHASAAAPSVRGPRRNRDYDLEHVSLSFSLYFGSYLQCFAFQFSGA